MRAYLDWNATAPPHPDVLAAMQDAQAVWGNPASVHAEGRAARRVVESAREAVAEFFFADVREVLFTSGGTEANNLGVVSAMQRPGRLLVSRLEHPSVARVAARYEKEGRVRWLRAAPTGQIDLNDLQTALEEGDIAALALLAVSSETGVIQPLDEAIGLTQARGIWVHVDAVQAAGRVQSAMNLARRADSVAIASHKLRGPKGIGALVTKPNAPVVPILLGGAQERGIRPGTVDAIACAGFAVAVRRAEASARSYAELSPMRDKLETALLSLGAERNGSDPRAAHVTNVAMAGWSGPELVAALDLEGIATSAGPACSAGTMEPSAALVELYGEERARRSVRMSLGESTTAEEIDYAIGMIRRVVDRAFRNST